MVDTLAKLGLRGPHLWPLWLFASVGCSALLCALHVVLVFCSYDVWVFLLINLTLPLSKEYSFIIWYWDKELMMMMMMIFFNIFEGFWALRSNLADLAESHETWLSPLDTEGVGHTLGLIFKTLV